MLTRKASWFLTTNGAMGYTVDKCICSCSARIYDPFLLAKTHSVRLGTIGSGIIVGLVLPAGGC